MTTADQTHDTKLSILNPHPVFLEGPSLLHHLIADENTDATALECHSSDGLAVQLSYKQLHHQTAELARLLQKRRRSSSSATITPILIPQSAALYISQIAILKSGSAFCPLNLDVPEERLKFILNDVSATIVITTSEFRSKFECIPDLEILVLDPEGHVVLSESESISQDETNGSIEPPTINTLDPAYIMYTSGSTGTPKAVCLSHKAVTQSLLAHDRFIPQFSRFLQFANPTFDVSVFEIYFPLFRGKTLVACDRTYLLSDLSNVITKLDVDGAELTPSVVASLVRSRKSVPKLRTLLTIGEMLNPQTVREFAGSSEEDSHLWGMYGPTEAAIHCTLQPSFKQSDTVNTIGVPLDTVSCFIIKPTEEVSAPDDVQIVSQGEVGELAVGGHQLADGYLNREEQTKAVFITHPKYGPLYRTGDKAKLTDAGLLECLGRISKGQVKLRGQRIELGEIEHAASKLEGVHAASASVIDGQLVLFCVADAAQIMVAHVEASCRKWLPRFMVPNDIIIMKDFPYLPSGKTDSKKLDADYKARLSDAPEEQRPASPDNRKLMAVLRDHISKSIKPTSNLSSAGLDSLKAIRLATELRKQGFPQLSAVDLLMCTTVRDLEALVTKSTSGGIAKTEQGSLDFAALREDLRKVVSETPAVMHDGSIVEDVFPCTPLQDAMLIETAKDPRAYCNSATLTLSKAIPFDSFVKAFRTTASRHTSLRSGFVHSPRDESAYAQVVWSEISDKQFMSESNDSPDFSLERPGDLLKPLRVIYTKTSSQVTILLHHALYDQWALDILVDDLYRALRQEIIPDRPSFAIVSRKSLEDRNSKTRQRTLSTFWKSYMTGASFTKLPNLTGKISKGRQLAVFKQQSCVKASHVERLAKRCKVSTSVIFQTAYGYLLSLYTGQQDVTVGTVFSGRTAAIEGVQDLIGPMLSTLPTRLSVTGLGRFRDLARAVQASNRDIMAHADFSLLGVKRAANIESGTPLFDSIFVWQGSPREALDQTDVRLTGTTDYVEFDLTLDVEPKGGNFELKATYRQDVLPKAQMKLFLDQLDLIVGQLVDFPECRMDELFVDVQSTDCLSIHNPDPAHLDCPGGLTRLVNESIKTHSDELALCFARDISNDTLEIETLTYRELSSRANQLAHFMLAEDLQPGDLVCIIMEKSIDLYVSILASIKAGCGYLPIVPSTPTNRLGQILKDASISFTICDGSSAEVVKSHGVDNVFTYDDIPLAEQSKYQPRTAANPHDVAYAVYTSGTTGLPKGVLVTHDNISSNIKVLADIYPVTPGARLLQACNQAFDVSVFEIVFAWSQGMCLCSASNDVLFRDLENSIRRLKITHLSLTPTVAALVRPDQVPDVQFLITAGEPITPSIHKLWADRGLYQGYGPSETTNICAVNQNMPTDNAINNIGRSFANTSTFVLPLNGDFAPLPRGALGELCFGGQQVFKGYQNMPDLTATKIINHPRYGRIYRSGDLGRIDPDGNILIEGRTDMQRKIRGQRIELGEVTSTLLRCNGVKDATTLVAGAPGSETLVSFWIPGDSSKARYTILDVETKILSNLVEIKKEIENNLPSYMLPSALIPIAAFPMTSQSKVDNACLIEDFMDLPDDYLESLTDEEGQDSGEWSEMDHTIRSILVETLGASESSINRNTSLFGLGLDSLSAIRLSSNLRAKLGVQIDVSVVLKRPRLALLAEYLDAQTKKPTETNGHVSRLDTFLSSALRDNIQTRCAEQNVSVDRILPCTPLQEAMLSASISQGSSAYLNRNVLKLSANPEQLKEAWTKMMKRHDILRTVFVSTEQAQYPFVQVVVDQVAFPWASASGNDTPEQLLNDYESSVPAVLDSLQTPFKITLYQRPDQAFLVIDMHHALYDANAMACLLAEVEQLQSSEQLLAPVQFDGFLEYMLQCDENEADSFFDGMLASYEPQPFPGVSLANRAYAAEPLQVSVSSDQLQYFQKKHSVSLLAIAQAAWTQVLSVLQNTSDLCFGNVVSGRTVPVEGVERLVAPCFNTLPVRAKLSEQKDNLALVEHLHHLNVEALTHQLTPLRRVQQRLKSGSRLFDSLVLLQQPEQQLDASVWSFSGEKGDMDFPCIVELVPEEQQLRGHLHYQSGLFGEGQSVSAVCDLFDEAINFIIQAPLSDFTYDTTIDRRGLEGILQSSQAKRHDSNATATSVEESDNDWTETEELIRDTLLEFSNVESKNVTRHTTIYRLGLDSISAIQVANKLKKQDIKVSAADILEHPTPAELAAFIEARSVPNEPVKDKVDLQAFDRQHRSTVGHDGVQTVRPCTAVQSGMLTAFLRSQGRDYLNHFAYDASFMGSAEKLRNAWKQVAGTNEMLRTGFMEVEDAKVSFAMATYEVGHLAVPVEIIRDAHDLVALAQQHQEQVLTALHQPAWRCKIIETDGKVSLFLSMQHALYDAASLTQILEQVRSALEFRPSSTQASIDPALAHILSGSQGSDEQKAFWSESLKGATPSRFPNLHPVIPSTQAVLDISYTCSMSRSELETLCSSQGVSLQAVFQAAWSQLLSIYTGEEQVTFGVVHSGRISQETQDACFPTINTLPLTCNTAAGSSALLQSLMTYNASIQKHCFTPLASIQNWLGLQNEALFDTIFAFQKPLSDQDSTGQWKLVYEKAAVNYAVSIEIEHLPEDVLRLRTTFDSALLPEQQGHVMLQQLESLALSLLGQSDSHEKPDLMAIVPAKNPVIESRFTLLHQMVDQTVAEYPDRIALEFISSIDDDDVPVSTQWTYRELDRKGNQVARLLHDRGVMPGQVVGLCFDKCAEAAFAFLGIVKAGCCILAIDATAPLARKDFILSDSGTTAVLCSEAVANELSDVEQVALLNLTEELHDGISDELVDIGGQVLPESLSYILYTSGTTGTPKGCEITQDNVVQALLAFQRLFAGRWTERSVWLQFASYHFDVAILEYFWTWSVGMKLLCAPRDMVLEDIAGFIDRFQITHLDLTPSLGRLLDPASVPTLHPGVFITGGEAVKPEMLRAWGEIGCLFNFYGPTECTIGVTTYPSVPTNGKAANIGWAFDNVGTCVLKPGTNDPVLRGGVGELCIFGKLVGKGYLNRPDLNDERFPHIEKLGERIYRTGDLVRVLHDDSFEFLGRADSQVKLRGQRLEIDEIVAVLLQSEQVKDTVCVVAREAEKQKDQLVAFICPSSQRRQGQPELYEGKEISTMIQQAKAACEEKLPGYMVPTHFIPIHYIPLSVNNKQDDKLLRQFYQSLTTAQLQELSLPGSQQRELNETEQSIVIALAETLGTELEDVKPDANLFALGLSSISAVQLARRLRLNGHSGASITLVMQNATISKLARVLSDSSTTKHDSALSAARQAVAACKQKHLGHAARALGVSVDAIANVAPCTPLQQGILFKSQSSDNGLYYNRFLFEVKDMDKKKLRQALHQLVNTTDMLRTAFVETEDGHIQVVRKEAVLDWIEDAELDSHHQNWIVANDQGLYAPFAVAVAGAKVQICIHHALYDGNSWGLLMQRLQHVYNDESVVEAPTFLDTLVYGPLQQVKGAKNFWQEQCSGAIFEEMQKLVDEPVKQDAIVTRKISGAHSIDNTRKALQVTAQALVQAAWLATLSKYHAGPTGLIVSGRSLEIDAENVIGPLFNTIPFAWTIKDGETWASFCKRCHDFNVATIPHQHTPLRDISKWLNKSPVEPLFETLFVFQHPSDSSFGLDQIMMPIDDERYVADYPLSFEAEQHSDQELVVTIGAQRDYCNDEILEQMTAEFENNLSMLTGNADAEIQVSNGYKEKIQSGPVERDLPDANGYLGSFDWTDEAKALRQEIASLASLQVTDIDEHSSIFAVGLDSIDAVKLSARLKKHGIVVAVSVIMKSQTIPKILYNSKTMVAKHDGKAMVESRRKRQSELEKAVPQSVEIPKSVEQILPATPMQEALVSEMIKSEYKAYFNHDILELSPGVESSKLEKAWALVVEANPILRTAFVAIDDPSIESTFAQIILRPGVFHFHEQQLGDHDEFESLFTAIADDVRASAELTPPLRLSLITKKDKTYLVLSIAHALYDGYSLSLLHSDVKAAYNGTVPTRPSYSSLVDTALDATGSQATSFWESLLSDVAPSRIPASTSISETTYRAEFTSKSTAKAITAFSKSLNITPQALIQGAWALYLTTLTRSLDVTYGLVLAGRDSSEAEDALFPTMNTVVSRSIIHGSAKEMLLELQDQLLRVREFQATPTRKLTQIAKRRSAFEGPLFDALFTYQKAPQTGGDGSELYTSVLGASDVEYPVAVEVEIVGETLVWRNAVKSNVSDQNGTEKMLKDLDAVLRRLIDGSVEEVLSFEGENVRVMGQESFKVQQKVFVSGKETESPRKVAETWSVVEEQIRDVVAKVANMPSDEVGKTTRLENLGIDSISAIKLASLLKQQGINMPVSKIIKAGTVQAMAAASGQQGEKHAAATSDKDYIAALLKHNAISAKSLGFKEDQIEDISPVEAGQAYMLAAWIKSEGKLFYPTFTYSLQGQADEATVNTAWQELVARHAILRTTFVATGKPDVPYVQVVRKVEDLIADRPRGRQPFASLAVARERDSTQLKLTIHHALYDGVSLQLMMSELEDILNGVRPASGSLNAKQIMQSNVAPSTKSAQQSFWTTYLADLPMTAGSSGSYTGSKVQVFNPSALALTSATQSRLRSTGLSLQSIFFATYAQLHAQRKQINNNDVILGVYLANRSEQTEHLVAPTVNLLPVRVVQPQKKTTEEVARQIQDDLKKISGDGVNRTSLWEIERWTGVKVDVFVNFIRLPESDGQVQERKIIITNIDEDEEHEFRERAEVVPVEHEAWALPEELSRGGVEGAYPASVDIEATVRDGQLAIGAFGFEGVIKLDHAKEVVQGLSAGMARFFS